MKTLRVHIEDEADAELERVKHALDNRPTDSYSSVAISVVISPERTESVWHKILLLFTFVRKMAAVGFVDVRFKRVTRSLPQNSLMWALLTDISNQVPWLVFDHVSGGYVTKKISKEAWKDIFTASRRKQVTAQGIDGGIVLLGTSTSAMTKKEMSETIEEIYAFGSNHDVVWSKK